MACGGGKFPGPVGIASSGTAGSVVPGASARNAAALGNVHQHFVTGREGENTFEKSDRHRNATEKQIGGKRVLRNLFRAKTRGQQSADFRSEREAIRSLRAVQGLDAQRVARQKKHGDSGMAPAQIEQSEGKHAAQRGETILAPFFPGMHKNLSVGLRGEAMAAE